MSPQCTNHGMETVRTSHNVVLQQGGSVNVSIAPVVVSGAQIAFPPVVTDARLDGFGQQIADLLKVNVKGTAQEFLDGSIDRNSLSLITPPEFRKFLSISSAKFSGLTDGSLRMVARGNFRITGPDALALCNQFWPAGKCASVE
jgi:hypothetical protein